MRPTLACGHTEYDRGHCGIVGCENDYFACTDCCPPTQRRGGGGFAVTRDSRHPRGIRLTERDGAL